MGKIETIAGELGLKPFGQKGWMKSDSIPCPVCGGSGDKVGIFVNDNMSISHCFRCGSVLQLDTYLTKIGYSYLVEEFSGVTSIDTIQIVLETKKKLRDYDYSMPTIEMPVGYRRIYSDPYINGRDFTPYQYDLFGVGTALMNLQLREYVIFKCTDNEETVGWLGRTRYSFDWHTKNLHANKTQNADLLLRYKNSPNTDFSKYVFGCEELSESVKTVIIVEGVFDKAATDRKLGLYTSGHTKCLCTFGKHITEYQIKRILDKTPRLERFMFMYDIDGIKEVRASANLVLKHFRNIEACILTGKDPDEMSQQELLECVNNSVSFNNFAISTVSIPNFKKW